VLQLVCHLERRKVEANPRAYPRHFGLTFLQMDDFVRLRDHVQHLGIDFVVRPMMRFRATPHEHHSFMIADPSGNVIEFKCYLRPENSY
jgi:extradiol dioxygenase family protein